MLKTIVSEESSANIFKAFWLYGKINYLHWIISIGKVKPFNKVVTNHRYNTTTIQYSLFYKWQWNLFLVHINNSITWSHLQNISANPIDIPTTLVYLKPRKDPELNPIIFGTRLSLSVSCGWAVNKVTNMNVKLVLQDTISVKTPSWHKLILHNTNKEKLLRVIQ